MKRSTIAAASVLTVALVGGGAAYALNTTGQQPTPVETTAVAEPSPEASATPTAAPATVTPSPTPTALMVAEAEEWFLSSGVVKMVDLPDADKLAAARYACDEIAAGRYKVTALEGVTEQFNRFFVIDSTTVFCPDLTEVYTIGNPSN